MPPADARRLGWQWILWVREGLRSGALEVNVEGGWAWNVEGRFFARLPACLTEFADLRGLQWRRVRNAVLRERRHDFVRGTRRSNSVLWRARLEDARMTGLAFTGGLFWDESFGRAESDLAQWPPASDWKFEGARGQWKDVTARL